MSAPLAQVVAAHPELAEILASPAGHTEVAARLTEMGHPTSESSVRRWRAMQNWTAARSTGLATLSAPVLAVPDVAEQGYQLAQAMRTIDLPDDPVSLLGYLEAYAGPGQKDLRVTRKQNADGITTVTVTAVRDDFAETAAGLMATRIAAGEGEHRCLKRIDENSVLVNWDPKIHQGYMPPLFPGQPLARYQRFATALVRKLKAAGWELTGDRDYSLTFSRHIEGEPSFDDRIDRILRGGREKEPWEEEAAHMIRVKVEGL